MTAAWALAIALHRNRHRVADPEYGPEPCGACQQEATSILESLPDGWALTRD